MVPTLKTLRAAVPSRWCRRPAGPKLRHATKDRTDSRSAFSVQRSAFPPARHDARSIKPPERIAGAAWQAGVTPNNERFRVRLDGEPRPDALAAGFFPRGMLPLFAGENANGWILILPDSADALAPRRIEGHIEIVPGE